MALTALQPRFAASAARPAACRTVAFAVALRAACWAVPATMSADVPWLTTAARRSPSPPSSPSQQPPAKRRRLATPPQAAPQQAATTTASPPAAARARPQQGAPGPKAAAAAQPAPKPAAAAEDAGDGLWLLVGLGNPGATYDNTRHNIGFRVIEELAKAEGIDCRKLEKSAAVGRGTVEGRTVLLVRPMTFMNNSGESVSALAKFHRVPTSRVLVVADDLDMPVAQVRLRQKGGHGGHNGLRSIVDRFGGTHDFPRLKIGIGRPSGSLPVPTFVLQEFQKSERPEVDVAVQDAISVIRSVLRLGMEKAMSGQRV